MSARFDRAMGVRSLMFAAVLVARSTTLVAALFTVLGPESPDRLGWGFPTAHSPAAGAAQTIDSTYDSPHVYAYPPQLVVAAVVVVLLLCLLATRGEPGKPAVAT